MTAWQRYSRATPILLIVAGLTLLIVLAKVIGVVSPRAQPLPRDVAARFLSADQSQDDDGIGADLSARPLFTDVAPGMGIRFVHDAAMHGGYHLPEEMGPGGAFLDFNNNGRLDVFVTGGGAVAGDGPRQACRLYRNDGGRFTDVTETSGAGVTGPAYGVACADYNHNGFIDIFITRLGPHVLLHNNGDETFTDVTREVGIDESRFGAGALFFDYDLDGWLDLFVTIYVDWSLSIERACYGVHGMRDYCNPRAYDAPTHDRLYRNLGNGMFEDVTEQAGIKAKRGNGLGALAADFNANGWPDIYVANDQTPAFLWRNNGDGTFDEVAELFGCAYDGRGVAIAGMGVACKDLTGDGRFDLFVTNITDQTHLILRNEGDGFTDASLALGMSPWSIRPTGFGIALFDQDNDGNLDGFIANGAVNVPADRAHVENPLAQPDQFVRMIDGRFMDVSSISGAAFNDVGRGVAWGDFDNDGNIDLLVLNNGGPARLLRNNNDRDHSWLIVDARTRGRAAIGARLEATVGDRTWRREVRPHSSYLSSSDARVHFGLDRAQQVDALTITWPDGSVSSHRNVTVNQIMRIEQSGAASGAEDASP